MGEGSGEWMAGGGRWGGDRGKWEERWEGVGWWRGRVHL